MTGRQMKRYARNLRRLCAVFERQMHEATTIHEQWCAMGICNWLNFIASDVEAMLQGREPTNVRDKDDTETIPRRTG